MRSKRMEMTGDRGRTCKPARRDMEMTGDAPARRGGDDGGRGRTCNLLQGDVKCDAETTPTGILQDTLI